MNNIQNTLHEIIPNIREETQSFFRDVEKTFGIIFFDRILVLKEQNKKYKFVYYAQYPDTCPITRELYEKEMLNVDFFVKNILKKQALLDGEGVFKCREDNEQMFDVMVCIGKYYIAFNNSIKSFKSIKKEHFFDETLLIDKLKKYTSLFEMKK